MIMTPAARLVAWLLLLVASAPVRAELEAALASHPDAAALRVLWLEGKQLERDDHLRAAAERWEGLAQALPGEAEPRWRIARSEWCLGERLSLDQKAARLDHFRRAQAQAAQGLALDPRCAECMFWLAAALGRITTTEGVVKSARQTPVIAGLLDRAIALRPAYRDSADDTTLGNLYHASAAFYRLVPDWLWLSWVLGVRGDKERSVDYSRRAVAISPSRLDYQVELGAGLLCLGSDEDREDLVREGIEVLKHSESLTPFAEVRRDRTFARLLIEHPERACSYTRDGWVEIDEDIVRAAGAGAGGG
jgi:tetratricopeptide (TPR) repeat protein